MSEKRTIRATDNRLNAETQRRMRALLRQGSTFIARVRGKWSVAASSQSMLAKRMRDEPDWELWRITP